jgi:hypothetical protein
MFPKILLTFLTFSVILLFSALAFAAGMPDPSQDPQSFFNLIIGAANAKNWGFLVVLGSIAAISLLRWGGGKFWPALKSDLGGTILAVAYGLLLPIAIVLQTGAKVSWQLYVAAITSTAAATGLYVWSKKLGRKLIELLQKKFGKTTPTLPPTTPPA